MHDQTTYRPTSADRLTRTLDRKRRAAGRLAHERADLREYRADRHAYMTGGAL